MKVGDLVRYNKLSTQKDGLFIVIELPKFPNKPHQAVRVMNITKYNGMKHWIYIKYLEVINESR